MSDLKVRILGCGFYGAHIASTLLDCGYENLEIHEARDDIFKGASGSNPARLHIGCHYPRSRETRKASQEHLSEFMGVYGHLTRAVPTNIYAIAAGDSLVDYAQYVETLRPEIDLVEIYDPSEYGLERVAGAILTGERHILVNRVREHFKEKLGKHIRYGVKPTEIDSGEWDVTIDCTFCSLGREGVNRYEPCVTYVFEGSYDKAVTIMDGAFPSFYPHYEEGHVSLTSAKYTPFARCKTTEEAQAILDDLTPADLGDRMDCMVASMMRYYPAFLDEYRYADALLAIRAMPLSGADSRLVGIHLGPRSIRVRAGKIDAIFYAAHEILKLVQEFETG